MQRKGLLFFIIIIGVICFIFLPFIVFGRNMIITVHDNLDQFYYKMFHDNHLFFRFDAPTKSFEGLSTLYYSQLGYSFTSLLYSTLNDFVAYSLNYFFGVLFGFLSMYILLKKVLKLPQLLSLCVSVCYAILPVIPVWNIAVGTLPLIIVVFYYFASSNNIKFSWKILFVLIYPFFSFFATIGIFICAFWFIGTIIISVKNKKINPNLVVGFFVLCVGYVLVDLRLFYAMFVVKEPLNRAIFDLKPHDVISGLKTLLRGFISYGGTGYYHATSLQRYIVLPIAGMVSIFSFQKMFFLMREATGSMFDRWKKVLVQTDNKIKLLFILEFLVVVFSGIAALYDSGIIDGFISKYIHILTGFNWGRIWIFNRVIWYIIFALCINCILQIDTITFSFHKKSERMVIPAILPKIVSFIVIGLQFIYIACSPVSYNDQIRTWFNEVFIKTGIAKKIFPQREFNGFISYREFFSEELFAEIKKDIAYSDEKVVAFGYHPSVLMYNGFNCIDGYNNAYPLRYMQKFRTLIAPELETNEEARHYYDIWGGRMYLYNSELSYQPMRNKNTSPVKLNIDMDVFINEFKGTYILSRAEITNAEALGLNLVRRYYKEASIYTIHLYKIK
ncbi:membrane protein [Spirochaetia bacterium]|nr:membrane protein [Spirochaetia bacterium]